MGIILSRTHVISRQKNRFKEKFIYHHGEFDPTGESPLINNHQEFDSFEAAFQKIDTGYLWYKQIIEIVHIDFRDYVIKKLVLKLNEKQVQLDSFDNQQKQLEHVLKIKLKCELVNNKPVWSYK